MQKTKRILWIAAALAAVLTVAVEGCKHDDEDDWTPLTIRNAVLEKYAGERTTVTVPDGVTGIGSKAFSGTAVTAVVIPSGVTDIAPDAFDDSKVTSISFIGSQKEWNKRFGGELADDVTVSCFIIDDKDVLIGYEGDETDIVIPAGFVKGIDAGVFSGRGITGVTIPGSVKSIGANAFADCTALAVVRIEAGVAYIGDGAFARCTALTSMVIPAGVTELGGGIFTGCTYLTELRIHESVTTIASDALTGTEGLKDVHYSGRKAQWEKLVAGKEQYFAGKTVHCANNEVWRYVPGQGTITPGDGTGDHTHTWKYVIDGERGHYQACECGYRSETEEHVYDGTDPECNTCGYRKANSGDPDCEHEYVMKQNASGHYTGCEHCAYASDFENHTWGNYENNGADGHRRTCTTAGCGYAETENHEYKYEKINDNNHKVTCKVCNYFAEMEHGYGEVTYQNDGHHQICADCKYDKVDDHAWGAYTSDSNGHDRTCTVCDCAEHLNHVWSNYTNDGGKTHTRKCTATDEDHTETKDHEYKYEKFSDTQHKVTCKDNCGYLDYSNHTWGEYTDNKNGTHTKTCQQECGEPVTEKHQYVSGACACGSHKPELAGGTIDENGVLIAYPGHDEKHVVIPDGVTGIGSNVFWEHWELESIVIPEGVESIGDAAFAGCHALTEVTIPSTVETIGGGAFQNCSKLEHLEIASGVKNIDHGAFQGCVGLTEVTIPGSMETIGSDAFQGCKKLNVITIPVSVTSIGKNALACGNLATVQYSGTIAQWLELSKDSGVGDNVTVKCLDGTVPYDIQDGTLRHYYGRETEVTIPWGKVDTIGVTAFVGTNVTTVTITEGVKHIGNGAFQMCKTLTKVEIPTSMESIGNGAFYECSGLTEIKIPASVKTIGKEAFSLSGIKTITYAGTKEKWLELSKNSGIGVNVTVTCSDGTVSQGTLGS
ncbi:MAG: leucine-rich repeat domain-containing protein [Treponemataceae bacterium]|nr:leucine-rich repeat domain-containing protein [Treponemataceae bacterium]